MVPRRNGRGPLPVDARDGTARARRPLRRPADVVRPFSPVAETGLVRAKPQAAQEVSRVVSRDVPVVPVGTKTTRAARRSVEHRLVVDHRRRPNDVG